MGVSIVTGKLGAGKGKYAVMQLLEAASEGRRIAGNLDLYLDKFAKKKAKMRYIRVPDKPTEHDFNSLGHGNPESYDEDRNGLLVLDELGTWLNSRSFQDTDRKGVIDWLIHARHHGWDVILICQNEVQIDKQVREALGEVFTRCIAMHKVKIPLIGWFLEMFSSRLSRLPRFHMASTRIGTGANSFVTSRITYRGDYLHCMYDTRQIFQPNPEARTYTQLSPYYFTGIPEAAKSPLQKLLSAVAGRAVSRMRSVRATAKPAPKPQSKLVQYLQTLPPETRIHEFRRLSRLGHV